LPTQEELNIRQCKRSPSAKLSAPGTPASRRGLRNGGHAAIGSLLVTALILIGGLAAACSDRPRTNPLDPANPETGGRPTGVTAISILDTIEVRWQAVRLRDLSGYNLYRQRSGEREATLLARLNPQQTRYLDLAVPYGVQHSYQVTALVGGFESPRSAAATTTPGPTLTWIADYEDRSVVKLSHGGQHEILRTFMTLVPFRLAVDRQRGSVWVLVTDRPSRSSGQLMRLTLSGQVVGSYGRFVGMAGFALDPNTGHIWVADSLGEGVLRFDAEGRLLAQRKNVPKIAAVAFNSFTQELWAATARDGRLLRISSQAVVDSLRFESQPLFAGRPLALEVQQRTGAIWVALGDSVMWQNVDGSQRRKASVTFRYASQVAVDQLTGECWVIDESRNSYRDSRVVKLNAAGERQFEVNGFDRPQALAVNPFDSSCYVADTLRGRIVIISASGAVQPVFFDLYSPYDVEVVDFSK